MPLRFGTLLLAWVIAMVLWGMAHGTSSIERCHAIGTSLNANAWRCRRSSAGPISTMCTARAARNSAITFAARSASTIMVPRPGPSSTRLMAAGDPIFRQSVAAHRPTSSPNIWLISGAVMKSPAAPSGSRVA